MTRLHVSSNLRLLAFGPALSVAALALAGFASPTAAWAGSVYRCPGAVLTYTDQLTPQQAKDRACVAIESGPVTVVQGNRPRAGNAPVKPISNGDGKVAVASPAAAQSAASAARPADQKVADREQRERDADARRILESELKREEAKLAELKRDFNGGEPERQGNEKNYQRYLDRVEDMKQSIARKESDVNAIRRELQRSQPRTGD